MIISSPQDFPPFVLRFAITLLDPQVAIRVPLFEITKFGNLSFEKRFCESKKDSSFNQVVRSLFV